MEAVEKGHEPAVDLLLEWGADPAQQSMRGTTPLGLARNVYHLSIKQKLEEALKE